MAAHLHWRLRIWQAFDDTNPYLVQAYEIEMRAMPGGADQCTGGTATHESRYGSSYDSAKAFDDDPATYWSSATYPLPTAADDTWIAYQFPAPVEVNQIRLHTPTNAYGIAAFDVESSDDGVTWTTEWSVPPEFEFNFIDATNRLYTRPGAAPSYWRLLIHDVNNGGNTASIGDLEFRPTVGGAAWPVAGGTCVASATYYSGAGPIRAFDGDPATYWQSNDAELFLGIRYAEGVVAAEVAITAASGLYGDYYQATEFDIQSSTDGVTWTTELAVTGQAPWPAGETRTFVLSAAARPVVNVAY